MTDLIQLEPEAYAFAEVAARSPLLFTLGPEQGRLALDQVQSGTNSQARGRCGRSDCYRWSQRAGGVAYSAAPKSAGSAASHPVYSWRRVGLRQSADA